MQHNDVAVDDRAYIHVVAGIIINAQQQVLLAKRPDHVHLGGYWEFPGGKIESAETLEQALHRELVEELGIEVKKAAPFRTVEWVYPEKKVALNFWLVTDFAGEPYGREGQLIQWVLKENLPQKQMPEANQQIVAALLGPTPKAVR